MTHSADPTNSQFSAYRRMWDYFNVTLFGGALRPVILNFSRAAHSLGFFAPLRWEHGEETTHEISLNRRTSSAALRATSHRLWCMAARPRRNAGGLRAVHERPWPADDPRRPGVRTSAPRGRAAARCASLSRKRVSPHVQRHTCALTILQATGDLRKVSLWLGHADMQTTMTYLRADPTEKIATVTAVVPMPGRRVRLRAPDKLIASLRSR